MVLRKMYQWMAVDASVWTFFYDELLIIYKIQFRIYIQVHLKKINMVKKFIFLVAYFKK